MSEAAAICSKCKEATTGPIYGGYVCGGCAGVNVTALPDELLGGVLREYREVKRKAAVGERVKIVSAQERRYPIGAVGTCTRNDQFDDWSIDTTLSFEGSEEDGFINTERADYVVLEPSEILVIDGARYRMVDRKAAVGERVIVVKNEAEIDNYDIGEVFVVNRYGKETKYVYGGIYIAELCRRRDANVNGFIKDGKYRVLEPVEPQLSELPATDQIAENIAVLAARVQALEERVATLERPKVETFADVEDTLMRAAQDARKRREARKSPQQHRDEIVERAKADIEELSNGFGGYAISRNPYTRRSHICDVEFVVNRDKRKVTAILRGCNSRDVRAVGRAICAKNDVFNAHIGRAIALRRALGLEVPAEYLSVPNPEEVGVGDYVETLGSLRFRVTYEGSAKTVTRQLRRGDALIIDDSREEVAA